ncbi:MAG: methyltransferase domain-containing protein [bacterium]|jgi:SAM-dependent methyltransferase|nr:class I SAM-dependent methyltransferase [candidate division KSB1 bacterium]MDH7559417.1 methyltransferase domain-containing protein [bacterium]
MAEKHFQEQQAFAKSYLLPYFREHLPGFAGMRVLEVGCAEAGLLDVLHEQGIEAVGLELSPARVAIARRKNPDLHVCVGDITDPRCRQVVGTGFDLVVMRDVIEHIAERAAALHNIRALLNAGGYLFVSFPPKYSAFAGHQQVGRSVLRFVPFVHLLPAPLVGALGRVLHEAEYQVNSIVTNRRLGLSIAHCERLCRATGFRLVRRELFIVRPIYRTRFGLRPLRLANIPVVREVVAMGYEALWRAG